MQTYSEWLEALAGYFFGPQFSGRRVRLTINRQLLDEKFSDLGGTTSFLAAVRLGPDWTDYSREFPSLCQVGLALHSEWKSARRPRGYPALFSRLHDIPPYFPFLCLLCLAWTEQDQEETAAHAFYSRLDPLYPNHNLRNQLGQWESLWMGLEEWATKRLSGARGEFVVERLGGMVHVGIPKSQVIFTPSRIAAFPDLFAALSLPPHANFDAETLGNLILGRESSVIGYIGLGIMAEIRKDSDLGKSALKLLAEHLLEWDGRSGSQSRTAHSGGQNITTAPVSLLLALESSETNNHWTVRFCTTEASEAEGITLPQLDWEFRRVEPQLSIVATSHGLVDAGPYLSDAGKIAAMGRWRDAETLMQPPSFEYRPKNLWFFDGWMGQRLVEGVREPPDEVYVLATLTGRRALDSVLSAHPTLSSEDHTATGLPLGHVLLYVRNLRSVGAGELSSIFGRDIAPKPRLAWISGGTRIDSQSARKVYAEYDLPSLHILSDDTEVLDVRGATYAEVESRTTKQLPGRRIRTYSLVAIPDEAVVIATVKRGANVLTSVSFGIGGQYSPDGPTSPAEKKVDRLGELVADAGMEGALGPQPVSGEWRYSTCAGPLGKPLSNSPSGLPVFKFLESLHHAGQRVTIQEFRRRAMQIVGVEEWRANVDLRWLAALGHVEVQLDQHGRRTHVQPVRRHGYMLPSRACDKFMGVVAGCGPMIQLDQLISIAETLEFDIRVWGGSALVPPRLLFLHREAAAFEMLRSDTGIEWPRHPAADTVAEWSADLSAWLNSGSIRWYEHEAPACPAEYVPALFTVSGIEHNAAPARLFCMSDPFTARHTWHVLVKNPAPMEASGNRPKHAVVKDPAWARWKTHVAIADGDRAIIPYYPNGGELTIPTELHVPYLLARALCLCTGLAPALVRRDAAYADSRIGVLPDDSPRYDGPCWRYSDIPRSIAEKVATKLGGELKDIPK